MNCVKLVESKERFWYRVPLDVGLTPGAAWRDLPLHPPPSWDPSLTPALGAGGRWGGKGCRVLQFKGGRGIQRAVGGTWGQAHVLGALDLREAKTAVFQTGGFPTLAGKVRIVRGPGAANRPRRKIPGQSPGKSGNPGKSGKSQKRTKKDKKAPIGKPPPFESTPSLAGLDRWQGELLKDRHYVIHNTMQPSLCWN